MINEHYGGCVSAYLASIQRINYDAKIQTTSLKIRLSSSGFAYLY